MKKTNRKSGFTLVELMVVAAIIAILSAIIVPLLTSNRDRAIAADGQNLLGATANGIKTYFAKTGETPLTVAVIGADDALLYSELGKSKYFKTPTFSTAPTAKTNEFTYVLTASIRETAGSFTTSDTLTLDDEGTWGGTVATAAHIE